MHSTLKDPETYDLIKPNVELVKFIIQYYGTQNKFRTPFTTIKLKLSVSPMQDHWSKLCERHTTPNYQSLTMNLDKVYEVRNRSDPRLLDNQVKSFRKYTTDPSLGRTRRVPPRISKYLLKSPSERTRVRRRLKGP